MAALDDIYYNRRNAPPRNLDLDLPQIRTSTRSSILPSPGPLTPSCPSNDAEKYATVGLGLVRLITENLVCHPFQVLRRQCQSTVDSSIRLHCLLIKKSKMPLTPGLLYVWFYQCINQVHINSKKYHIVPITLVPVVLHLHSRQGITTLWKGVGSALLVRGLTMAVEDFLSKMTPLPKEITRDSSLKSIGHHLLLKCISFAVVTPFYAASVVETVQSEIASEKPGVLDVFKEGLLRLINWSSSQSGFLLPIWVVVGPTVLHELFHYVLSTLTAGLTRFLMLKRWRTEQEKQGAVLKDSACFVEHQRIEIMARFVGCLTADVLLYPIETVLHRLHLQGTRTIIDSLDTGYAVVPILTRYEGLKDCWQTLLKEEGKLGFYKGFGALIMQHMVQLAILRGSFFIAIELGSMLRNQAKEHAPPPVYSVPPVVNGNAALQFYQSPSIETYDFGPRIQSPNQRAMPQLYHSNPSLQMSSPRGDVSYRRKEDF